MSTVLFIGAATVVIASLVFVVGWIEWHLIHKPELNAKLRRDYGDK